MHIALDLGTILKAHHFKLKWFVGLFFDTQGQAFAPRRGCTIGVNGVSYGATLPVDSDFDFGLIQLKSLVWGTDGWYSDHKVVRALNLF